VRRAVSVFLFAVNVLGQNSIPDEGVAKFGTTVVGSGWFRGDIYHLHHWATRLPDFSKMKPVGSIYTPVLNVTPHNFSAGFPGVTNRYEFFGINYTARIWIQEAGIYTFWLLSDDGADLYVDDRLVVDNDGQHVPIEKQGGLQLASGVHYLRVPYFQGPKYLVALVLKVQGPKDSSPHILNTEDFKPPDDVKSW
jgi:hypothetical protein